MYKYIRNDTRVKLLEIENECFKMCACNARDDSKGFYEHKTKLDELERSFLDRYEADCKREYDNGFKNGIEI